MSKESALYLPNGAAVGVPAAGTQALFIDTDNTFKTMDSTGAKFVLGGASFLQARLARAQALLGTTVDTVLGTDFENDQWHVPALAGSGTIASSQTAKGGVIVLSTGATGSSSAIILPHGSPSYVASLNTDKWYAYARAALTTTPNANAISETLDVRGISSTVPSVQIGVWGSVSTGFWVARTFNNAAGVTSSTITTVPFDTAYHTFEIWSDGTATVSFAIDGVIVATTGIANLGTGAVTIASSIFNQGTAANQSVSIDKIAMCVVGN